MTDQPITFSLYDSKDQQFALYITQDPQETHSLTLELYNTSGKTLRFQDKTGQPSKTNYHVAVIFDAGILSPATLDALSQSPSSVVDAPEEWAMKLDQAAKFVSLYFLYTGQKKELAAGEHRYITLNRISANAGKSKTQVEFMPPQVIDSTTNKASSTDSSSQNLDVITHRGSQINPFHAAFIDSNRILNDGVSEITLKLQVMNVINPEAIAGADPNIALKAGKSQFVIAFDLADENGTQAWALCRTAISR